MRRGTYSAGFFLKNRETRWNTLRYWTNTVCILLDEGYDVLFALNGAKVVVNGSQEVCLRICTFFLRHGQCYSGSCSYDASSKTFSFVYEWTVSAGTFGESLDTFTIK